MRCSYCGFEDSGNFCSNCGAPLANTVTAPQQSWSGSSDQPRPSMPLYRGNLEEEDVKEASLSFVSFFLLIWGLGFGGIPLTMILSSEEEYPLWIWLFVIIGLGAVGFFVYKLVLSVLIAIVGEDSTGTVIDYQNDTSSTNGAPNQVALIEVTENGIRKILRYQIGAPKRAFAIGSTVNVRRWGNVVKVTNSQWNQPDTKTNDSPFLR